LREAISSAIGVLLVASIVISTLVGGLLQQKVYGTHEAVPIFKQVGLKCPDKCGKFVGYGHNTNPRIATELRGTVIYVDNPTIGQDMYILPDVNYQNLLLPGNYIVPLCEPVIPIISPDGSCPNEFHFWEENILNNYIRLGLPYHVGQAIPVIKLELQPPTDDGQPFSDIVPGETNVPHLALLDSQTEVYRKITRDEIVSHFWGPLRSDKPLHVVVYGLYVQEHQHSMYGGPSNGECIDAIIVKPRLPTDYLKCYGHTELHPYYENFMYEINDNIVSQHTRIYTERHTVVAPIYTQFYSDVAKINAICIGCIPPAGRLVDDSESTEIINHFFFLKAPPRPPECSTLPCNLHFQESVLHNILSAPSDDGRQASTSSTHEIRSNPAGASVTVYASGYHIDHPTIYQADLSTK
jgi:hypothetical protein